MLKLSSNAEYMMTQVPDKIIYCYSIIQNKLEKFARENSKVELHEGFSSDLYVDHDPSMHTFIIIDDLMNEDIYSEMADLFTKYSRHKNISVAFLTQVFYSTLNPKSYVNPKS